MKKRGIALILAVLVIFLGGCGQNKKPVPSTPLPTLPSPETTQETAPALADPENYCVLHPDFLCSNGFVEPVERLEQVPEGFIALRSAEDFLKIDRNPEAWYLLLCDIDLTGLRDDSRYLFDSTFRGMLDGNGYKITGLRSCIFRWLKGATVIDLALEGDLEDRGAALALEAKDSIISNCSFDGSIRHLSSYTNVAPFADSAEDCTFRSCVNRGDITVGSGASASGIVGQLDEGSITNCLNLGRLESQPFEEYGEDKQGRVGGIVASTLGEEIYITFCKNAGALSGGDCAGICASAYGDPIYIDVCCNEGDLEGRLGAGISIQHDIGRNNLYISQCYNAGDINTIWSYGISAINAARIYACYNIGTRSGGSMTGGISENCKDLDSCYYLDVHQDATADGALFPDSAVRALTREEMTREESFVGFFFDGSWAMGRGDYPYPVFGITDPFGKFQEWG